MTPASPSEGPVGLLLSNDLIYTAKITGTARELGARVLWADSPAQVSQIFELSRPKAVFVDLSAGELVRPDALMLYRQMAPTATFVAFGPHVDTGALAAASSAGCEVVLTRSNFSATLPRLIRRYLLEDPEWDKPRPPY